MFRSSLDVFLLWPLLLLGGCKGQKHCTKVTFEVTATAENTVFVDLTDLNNSTAVATYLVNGVANGPPTNCTATVSGTFEIGGMYCQPNCVKATDKGILQYFIHGATYNQTMWTGLGINDKYNWPLLATNRGYYTLILDSLGHGDNPARPDLFNVLQSPLQVEINHMILSTIRHNSRPLGRTFKKVVLVAHSYGSSTSVSLLRSHPRDIEAFVMTGWSTSLSRNAAVAQEFVPGVDVLQTALLA